MHPRMFLTSLAAVLLVANAASAQTPSGGTTVPSDPVFEAVALDGTRTRGRIAAIQAEDRLTLDTDSGPLDLPLEGLFALERDPWPTLPATAASRSVVLFPGGDRLRAIVGTVENNALRVRPPIFEDAETALPLDQLLGVVLAPPVDAEARDALLREVAEGPRDRDHLWLANGDRLAGVIDRIGSETFRVELDAGGIDVPRSSVSAFAFDPALVNPPELPDHHLELTFVDGSRLAVVEPRIEKGRLVARARFGAEVRPAISAIARVVVRGRAVAFLSERAESAAEYVGYLGTHPGTYGRDRTWDGHPLAIRGVPYDRGLGTLPLTRLAYVLRPGDRRFQATVGLDDRAGERGNVVFRVFVDRQERFTSPPLTSRDETVPVDVDLNGGRVLILVTDFGESGDVQDVADWIDARLIVAPPAP